MRKLSLTLFALALAFPLTASAQQPASTKNQIDTEFEELMTAPTAEMWFYLQEMRRYDDPKNVVRRNAELRSAQRRERIAAMKWYGMSNSRPRASATPYMGVYSPQWGGERYHAPYFGYYRVTRSAPSSQIYVLNPRENSPSLSKTAYEPAPQQEEKLVANAPQSTDVR